jgi:glycosyltransferase involved in cell wall biosynthesis
VSRLVASKDVATAIRGFAAARDGLAAAVLVILGDGPLRDDLHGIARESGVADRVRFVGHVPAADVQGWLSIASLTVLASREEPFGAVVAEGLAHGVPCVCSSGAGAAVLIDRTSCGVVVPPGDVAAFAAALRSRAAELRPLDDPMLLERADLRRATVADDVAGFMAAVEHAIGGRRHGPSP